ncbi:MAG: PTS sugar transporter subunit IIA [Duodenibacillus sp.]|nr:PTS sugar transporter subunit IIA [Duodenibacillus sp.]HBC68781.1 hypothetical protein [Sutterella sp.]
MANTLSSFLTLDNVALDLNLSSMKRVIETASLMLEKDVGINHQTIFNAIIAREKLGNTCLGGGVSLPHARLGSAPTLKVAVLRTTQSVHTGAIDNRRAKLFFVAVIPQDGSTQFPEIVREVRAIVDDTDFKIELMKTKTPIELCQMIGNWSAPKASA